jgi:hypothetical protein
MPRGASNWKLGDSIFLLEAIMGDGTSYFRIFPNEKGFKASLAALQNEIKMRRGYTTNSWAVKDYRTYIMPKTDWQPC